MKTKKDTMDLFCSSTLSLKPQKQVMSGLRMLKVSTRLRNTSGQKERMYGKALQRQTTALLRYMLSRNPSNYVSVPRIRVTSYSNIIAAVVTAIGVYYSITCQGWFHLKLQVICGLCLMTTIIEMLSTGYVLPPAQCDLQLTTEDGSLVNAIGFVGMLFSSHLWGFVADTKGRRKILIFSLLMDSACTVLSSFAHAVWLLVIIRFFNGFFICCSAAVLFAYFGEFHPEATRARAIVWLGVFVAGATLSLPGLAWLVIPLDFTFELPWYTYRSWRLFLLLCAAPGSTTALLFWLLLPKSPKFLLVSGKHNEAMKILRDMYAANTGNSPDDYPVKAVQMDAQPRRDSMLASPPVSSNKSARELLKNMIHQTMPLFKPPYLKNTAIACVLDFAIFSCSNGFQLWLPDIFKRMSVYKAHHPEAEMTICETIQALIVNINSKNFGSNGTFYNETDLAHFDSWPEQQITECTNDIDPRVFKNTLIIGGATAAAYIIAGFLVPYVGKRNVLITSMITSGAAGIAMYFMWTTSGILGFACIFIGLSTMCVSVVNSIVVDLFPTQLRAMAVCLSLMSGRLGTAVGCLLIGHLLEMNCAVGFIALSGIILASGFLGFLISPLTTMPLA